MCITIKITDRTHLTIIIIITTMCRKNYNKKKKPWTLSETLIIAVEVVFSRSDVHHDDLSHPTGFWQFFFFWPGTIINPGDCSASLWVYIANHQFSRVSSRSVAAEPNRTNTRQYKTKATIAMASGAMVRTNSSHYFRVII